MSNQNEVVETGERYAKSSMIGDFYRVTKWVDLGEGTIQARQKEEVDRENVPYEWLETLE